MMRLKTKETNFLKTSLLPSFKRKSIKNQFSSSRELDFIILKTCRFDSIRLLTSHCNRSEDCFEDSLEVCIKDRPTRLNKGFNKNALFILFLFKHLINFILSGFLIAMERIYPLNTRNENT